MNMKLSFTGNQVITGLLSLLVIWSVVTTIIYAFQGSVFLTSLRATTSVVLILCLWNRKRKGLLK